MPTYTRADSEVYDLIKDLYDECYPDLAEAKVTINALMARPTYNDNGEPKGPAIRHEGYPAQATIKVTSLKDRVAGLADAILTIDADNWDNLDEAERLALIDHELYHLELERDKHGHLVSDDHGRPKLKCRLHDWQIGGFAAIRRRRGEASPEHRHIVALADQYGQLLFEWMAPVGAGV